jgi:hypothetical protein
VPQPRLSIRAIRWWGDRFKSSRKRRDTNLPSPYLKRLWFDPATVPDREAYPFCLPFLSDDFELNFDRAMTIIVGENAAGKSTLLEGSPRSPAMTRPAAAKAIGRSIMPMRSS